MFFSPLSIAEGKIRVSTLDDSPDDGLTIRAALKALAAKISGKQLPLGGQHIAHRGPTGLGKESSP
jgi:hypothetical protein